VSKVVDIVMPTHVARQRYLVTPARLARPKGLDPQIFFWTELLLNYLIKVLKI
jgi:hypothetical protein